VLLNEPGGKPITRLTLPEVQRNGTSISSIGYFFTPGGLPQTVCGHAQVFVHAVGADTFTPSNVLIVPACFGPGTVTFPDTGAGPGGHRTGLTLPLALLAVGALFLAAGLAFRHARSLRA
jgi:hypothetical protein